MVSYRQNSYDSFKLIQINQQKLYTLNQELMNDISNHTSLIATEHSRNTMTTLLLDSLQQKSNFLQDADSSKTQIYTDPHCQCVHLQKKIRALQTKMKKLMHPDQKTTSQDTNIDGTEQQNVEQGQESDNKDIQQPINRVSLKEESQMLASVSQQIEEIIRRQKENQDVLNSICVEQQKSNTFKSERNKSKLAKIDQHQPNLLQTSSSHPEQSLNLKQGDSDFIQEMINLNASLNASRVSNDSEGRSQKSDLSGSITSERHSQILQMTEEQKKIAYKSQIKNAKMMAKLKKRK